MYIPYYDEFLIYTTREEILEFIEELLETGISLDEALEKSKSHFGSDLVQIIEYILLDEQDFEF